VAVAPFVLELIPTASLAAVLVYTGYRLVNVEAFKTLGTHSRADQGIYLLTVTAIVSTDLLTGVLAGFLAAVAKVLHDIAHVEVTVTQRQDGIYDMDMKGAATFLRVPLLGEKLEEVPRTASLHVHLHGLLHADQAIMDLLRDWGRQAEAAGGELVVDWDQVDEGLHYRTQIGHKLQGGAPDGRKVA
jgi:MFS superfamily sulfate permease-like transporter